MLYAPLQFYYPLLASTSNMSIVKCMRCPLQLIIPCCVEREYYHALCRNCLKDIDQEETCLTCKQNIAEKTYQIYRKLTAYPLSSSLPQVSLLPSQPSRPPIDEYRRPPNYRPPPPTLVKFTPTPLPSLLLPSFQPTSYQTQPRGRYTNSFGNRNYEGEWEISEEDVLKADAAMDLPMDIEGMLRKERKKNGITGYPTGNPRVNTNTSFFKNPYSHSSEEDTESVYSLGFTEYSIKRKEGYE